jgi:hypothetical protein
MPRGNTVASNHTANCEIVDSRLDSPPSRLWIDNDSFLGLRTFLTYRIRSGTDSIMTAPKSLIQPSDNLEVETIRDKRTAFWDEWRGAVTSRFQTGATAHYGLDPKLLGLTPTFMSHPTHALEWESGVRF